MKTANVIGSGILGAATAYHLSKQGVQVTIIDRDDEGQATKAAAGIICPWFAQRRNKAWYQLASGGAAYYPELIKQLTEDGETNTGYKRVGMLGLHTDENRLLKAEQRVLKRRENAPEIGDVTLLNEEETNQLFPLLNNNYRSLHISGGARVNGHELRNALLRGAKKHGAVIVKGNAQLIKENNRIVGVTVNNESIDAQTTIAATGAWMNELLEPLDIKFLAYPQKAQIIHLKVEHEDTDKWPVVMPPNNQYILPTENKRIIIGATHETKAGFDNRVTAGGVYEVLSKALEVAPDLASSTLIEIKTGFRPFTPGSLPVIGKVPQIEGFILATGLGASGLTIGPYVGKEIAKLATGEQLDIDLKQYDIENAIE